MSDKLNEREQAIMHEAFMVGRIYATNGEKESPSEIHDKLLETCTKTARRYSRTEDQDIQINTYVAGNKISMQLVHLPTSTWVKGDGKSHFLLKKKLRQELHEKMATLDKEK